jgi:hypothetical protein
VERLRAMADAHFRRRFRFAKGAAEGLVKE